tara:strand:+ start:126 stop:428 length:303 start_codon:yes stop_codon:yes gene_type:complete
MANPDYITSAFQRRKDAEEVAFKATKIDDETQSGIDKPHDDERGSSPGGPLEGGSKKSKRRRPIKRRKTHNVKKTKKNKVKKAKKTKKNKVKKAKKTKKN